MSRSDIRTLPYLAYYLTALLLSISGIANSLYLFYAHYQNYTNPYYSSFCAISKAINCDTVAQSGWSVLFGMPVALWGVLGYLLLFLLLIPLRKPVKGYMPLWALVFGFGAIFAIASVVLGLISAIEIKSYCILCLLTYTINLGFFFISWIIVRRFGVMTLFDGFLASLKIVLSTIWLKSSLVTLILLAVILIFQLPPYWSISPAPHTDDIPSGITKEGYPWIGAENPKLIINEFSDYMCFQCKKMHFFLRQMVQAYPDKIRLVHRHFPMDHQINPLVKEQFHTGSGKMSIIAMFAQAKEQFWEVNDLLFELGNQKSDFNTATIAEEMNINSGELVAALSDQYYRLRIKHDIAVGIDKGINGTPSFIIDNTVYIGNIPKNVLQKIAVGIE
jgi:protein-disulfide isomerase/uncharacterized membrane protein